MLLFDRNRPQACYVEAIMSSLKFMHTLQPDVRFISPKKNYKFDLLEESHKPNIKIDSPLPKYIYLK